jgi:hypothetical protein
MDVTSGDDIMQHSAWVFRFGIPSSRGQTNRLRATASRVVGTYVLHHSAGRQHAAAGGVTGAQACCVRLKHTEVSDDSSIGGAGMHAL